MIDRFAPPKIYHDPKRPGQYASMVLDCAKNIHLRQQAKRLLAYYADQGNTFAPAKKTIAQATGIPVDDVDRVRRQLVEHGLIYYLPMLVVIIQWHRIAAYALLETPISHCRLDHFQPAKLATSETQRVGDRRRRKEYFTDSQSPLSKDQKRMVKILERMTLSEYSEWLNFGRSVDSEEKNVA